MQFALIKLIGLEIDDNPAILFFEGEVYYTLHQEIKAGIGLLRQCRGGCFGHRLLGCGIIRCFAIALNHHDWDFKQSLLRSLTPLPEFTV
ncbi:hypothetical protein D3C76_805900 [compost metagenome]